MLIGCNVPAMPVELPPGSLAAISPGSSSTAPTYSGIIKTSCETFDMNEQMRVQVQD